MTIGDLGRLGFQPSTNVEFGKIRLTMWLELDNGMLLGYISTTNFRNMPTQAVLDKETLAIYRFVLIDTNDLSADMQDIDFTGKADLLAYIEKSKTVTVKNLRDIGFIVRTLGCSLELCNRGYNHGSVYLTYSPTKHEPIDQFEEHSIYWDSFCLSISDAHNKNAHTTPIRINNIDDILRLMKYWKC